MYGIDITTKGKICNGIKPIKFLLEQGAIDLSRIWRYEFPIAVQCTSNLDVWSTFVTNPTLGHLCKSGIDEGSSTVRNCFDCHCTDYPVAAFWSFSRASQRLLVCQPGRWVEELFCIWLLFKMGQRVAFLRSELSLWRSPSVYR